MQKGRCKKKALAATRVEATIWGFISALLKDPERIRAAMDRLIERERAAGRKDFAQEARVWEEKIVECARLRGAYQDQQAAGLVTLDELGSKLKELEGTRQVALSELAALGAREKRIKELEEDRDALLEAWAGTLPDDINALSGEERNKVYRLLRLEITLTGEGYKISGP